MNYIIDHIPVGLRRPTFPLTPNFITIHSTSNETSTAKNEMAWLTNPINCPPKYSPHASWHIVVDEKEAIEAIPLNEIAWHAGDGAYGVGNRQSIGIEICESGDREKTLINTVKVVATLLKKFNLSIDEIRQHYDWVSAKNCPRILRIDNLWDRFILDVKKEMANDNKPNWKEEIMQSALSLGLITSENHSPDEAANKWFVLAVALNVCKKIANK